MLISGFEGTDIIARVGRGGSCRHNGPRHGIMGRVLGGIGMGARSLRQRRAQDGANGDPIDSCSCLVFAGGIFGMSPDQTKRVNLQRRTKGFFISGFLQLS